MGPSRSETDPKLLLDALMAVRDALGIPNAGTMGGQEIRDAILVERAGHAVVMLGSIFERIEDGRDPDIEWSVAYLRERLAEHSATGYKTWDERMTALGLARQAGGAR
jgi:hypothetical protein